MLREICIISGIRRLHSYLGSNWEANEPELMTNTSSTLAVPKRQARTRMGNGSTVLAGVDGRASRPRRYREILAQLSSDMGGDPSEAQTQIARRAAELAVWSEDRARALMDGEEIDIGEFTTATNALRRLLADLGLERRARDVTPTPEGVSQFEAVVSGSPASNGGTPAAPLTLGDAPRAAESSPSPSADKRTSGHGNDE